MVYDIYVIDFKFFMRFGVQHNRHPFEQTCLLKCDMIIWL